MIGQKLHFGIMRTLSEIPEIEEKIIDGTLNQSTVSKAIQFINKEARIEDRQISVEEKCEIFSQIENLSHILA